MEAKEIPASRSGCERCGRDDGPAQLHISETASGGSAGGAVAAVQLSSAMLLQKKYSSKYRISMIKNLYTRERKWDTKCQRNQ
jgi:hypothetical protein